MFVVQQLDNGFVNKPKMTKLIILIAFCQYLRYFFLIVSLKYIVQPAQKCKNNNFDEMLIFWVQTKKEYVTGGLWMMVTVKNLGAVAPMNIL